jgi:hypothetical protein
MTVRWLRRGVALAAVAIATIAAIATLGALASGCASIGAKPWERDILSERSMRLGADAIDVVIDDHIYFSKEASSGGRGVGGGGCGCN